MNWNHFINSTAALLISVTIISGVVVPIKSIAATPAVTSTAFTVNAKKPEPSLNAFAERISP